CDCRASTKLYLSRFAACAVGRSSPPSPFIRPRNKSFTSRACFQCYGWTMAIRVALHHVTRHRYDRPVRLSPHVVRLRPAPHCRTPIVSYSLKVTPAEQFVNWQQDPFGNHLARFVFREPAQELSVEVDLVADLVTINPFDFFLDEGAETFPIIYDPALKAELVPYLERV